MQNIVFIGSLIYLIFNIHYVIATVKGDVQPNRVSWFLWSLAPLIAVFASLSVRFSWSQLPVLMAGTMPLLIFIASFFSKKHYFEFSRLDVISGTISVITLIFWGLTQDANIAIWLSIISDATAGIPTIWNSWKHPEKESPAPFASGLVATLTGTFALQSFTFSEIAFPIYLIALDSTMTILICRKYFLK
jgi:hypothetical protein